jgi:prevent-host-death family protein
MRTVGIRELKIHLSTYVDYAKRGEEVVVTEHGREVALLVPITDERRAVFGLVAEGAAKWSGGKPAGLAKAKISGESLAETIIADRR